MSRTLGAVILRARHRAAQEMHGRGRRAEDLVVQALGRSTRPAWLLAVRRATTREDRKGVDVVVETLDMGRLYLQVKSSEAGRRRWLAEAPHRDRLSPCEVLVVGPGDDLAIAYGRALGKLILMREARWSRGAR